MLILFPKIKRLAMSGKMGSGKSTISKKLSEKYDYNIVSISSSIKKTSTLLIDNPTAQLNYLVSMLGDNSKVRKAHHDMVDIFKSKFSSITWDKDIYGNYIKNQAYRDLSQIVGMKTREYFGEDVFVKFTVKEADILTSKGIKVICDDVRLPEEKILLEDKGFHIIRINVEKEEQYRRLLEMYGVINEDQINHITETALDNASFNYITNTTHTSTEDTLKDLSEYLCS